MAKIKSHYLAYLDILGFKKLIEKKSLQTITDVITSVLDNALKSAITKESVTVDEQKNLNVLRDIHALSISDSIIIWTANTNTCNFTRLIKIISEIYPIFYSNGFLLRGAITYGKLFTDEKKNPDSLSDYQRISIIGEPWIIAVKEEENQQWTGCTIHTSVIKYLRSSPDLSTEFMYLKNKKRILNYPVLYCDPKNNICIKKRKNIVNWLVMEKDFDKIEPPVKVFASFNRKSNSGIQCKIKETEKFIEYIKKNKFHRR